MFVGRTTLGLPSSSFLLVDVPRIICVIDLVGVDISCQTACVFVLKAPAEHLRYFALLFFSFRGERVGAVHVVLVGSWLRSSGKTIDVRADPAHSVCYRLCLSHGRRWLPPRWPLNLSRV